MLIHKQYMIGLQPVLVYAKFNPIHTTEQDITLEGQNVVKWQKEKEYYKLIHVLSCHTKCDSRFPAIFIIHGNLL